VVFDASSYIAFTKLLSELHLNFQQERLTLIAVAMMIVIPNNAETYCLEYFLHAKFKRFKCPTNTKEAIKLTCVFIFFNS